MYIPSHAQGQMALPNLQWTECCADYFPVWQPFTHFHGYEDLMGLPFLFDFIL